MIGIPLTCDQGEGRETNELDQQCFEQLQLLLPIFLATLFFSFAAPTCSIDTSSIQPILPSSTRCSSIALNSPWNRMQRGRPTDRGDADRDRFRGQIRLPHQFLPPHSPFSLSSPPFLLYHHLVARVWWSWGYGIWNAAAPGIPNSPKLKYPLNCSWAEQKYQITIDLSWNI